jgi:hypothetical protein
MAQTPMVTISKQSTAGTPPHEDIVLRYPWAAQAAAFQGMEIDVAEPLGVIMAGAIRLLTQTGAGAQNRVVSAMAISQQLRPSALKLFD